MDKSDMESLVLGEMKKLFNPEFINRLDETIVFEALTEEELVKIAALMLTDVSATLRDRGLEVRADEEVFRWLVKSTCKDRQYGARPLRRAIQSTVEDVLSEKLIAGELPEKGIIEITLEDNKLAFRERVPEELGVN
jgi:ATP-dependent Clp protease ATP-binding subunit ClpC